MNAFEIKIEKEIPIPSRKGRTGFTALVRQMTIGDSVLVTPKQAASIVAAISREKGKCARRTEGDKIRIWRTA